MNPATKNIIACNRARRFGHRAQPSRKGFKNILTRTRAELALTDQAANHAFFEVEKPDRVYLATAKVGDIYAKNIFPAEFIYENLTVE